MLSFQSLILLIALASAAMLSWNNWRAREHAERLARDTCKRMGLQFLDDSVGMKNWRIVRDADPHTGLVLPALSITPETTRPIDGFNFSV